jgi:enoyl-CoA hydratase/carnithine racemase
VLCEAAGPAAVVTLSHPARLGAMTRTMWRELKSVFEALQQDAALRCIVVRGEGGAFCAGGDIAEYPAFRFDPEGLRAFHEEDVWGGLAAILACDVPVLAQIEGACMGAGMEIASCCDLRVAAAGATFGAPIGRLGFPMAPREAELVAAAAGLQTAREMLLEAAVLDAAEMKARGFLNRVVAAADVAASVQSSVARILRLAPQAARMNKQMLRALQAGGRAAAGALAKNAYDYAPSEEHREGVTAFLAKRQPQF